MAAFASTRAIRQFSQAVVSTPARARAQATRTVRVNASAASDYAKSLPGVTSPFPGYFDPLNLSEGASVDEIKRWREAELTHGRVSMLAALGFIVGEQGDGGFPLFDGDVTGPAINQFQQVPPYFWLPLTLVIGICEAYRVGSGWAPPTSSGFYKLKDEYTPGDVGFDPLGLKPEDADELFTLQTKELNNGRLAMIAIAGFVAQELADGGDVEIFEHWFSTAEKEIGLQ
eukprot:CAMPEP_0117673520 /NCGR_PEP_ID=MMETSP0804-20121206/14518_1 /TAXON_ID=1074897 /ORGANISM="Tetraselmis astigmatica, Strain CCMP880" /LENGTH=228 /DNA_ID=CAMNT_0005482267 /DNA_START=204 /DNA_END=890 /DNA_ORIENTATION=-